VGLPRTSHEHVHERRDDEEGGSDEEEPWKHPEAHVDGSGDEDSRVDQIESDREAGSDVACGGRCEERLGARGLGYSFAGCRRGRRLGRAVRHGLLSLLHLVTRHRVGLGMD